jgi:hypothetical protein
MAWQDHSDEGGTEGTAQNDRGNSERTHFGSNLFCLVSDPVSEMMREPLNPSLRRRSKSSPRASSIDLPVGFSKAAEARIYLGQPELLGERGFLTVLLRLRHNPFVAYVKRRIEAFLE